MTDWGPFVEEEYGCYDEDGQFLGDGLSEAVNASVQQSVSRALEVSVPRQISQALVVALKPFTQQLEAFAEKQKGKYECRRTCSYRYAVSARVGSLSGKQPRGRVLAWLGKRSEKPSTRSAAFPDRERDKRTLAATGRHRTTRSGESLPRKMSNTGMRGMQLCSPHLARTENKALTARSDPQDLSKI
ncbi:hypothetical protein NDU88_006480 [Pleurodeles waltl]|uniref:Uncharacterized protein n=1 Tax=Pleurodeles waltl TaxID=8319 RepID=A0AAV7L3T5_PLEWA|nr:hypothetical protein NDU88_006480 [Pleurodeles waltl]